MVEHNQFFPLTCYVIPSHIAATMLDNGSGSAESHVTNGLTGRLHCDDMHRRCVRWTDRFWPRGRQRPSCNVTAHIQRKPFRYICMRIADVITVCLPHRIIRASVRAPSLSFDFLGIYVAIKSLPPLYYVDTIFFFAIGLEFSLSSFALLSLES